MITSNFIQSMFRQTSNSNPRVISFQTGQIFNGKIVKIFPNQTAEVQVGSEKVIAQLEVPLSVNDRYWFQVQPGEGKVHLKVVTPMQNNEREAQASMEGLLKQLGVPASKESINLVRFLMKENLPLVKESIQLAAEWLTQVESESDGLEAIKQIMMRNLPLSKDVFLGLQATVKNEPLHSLMTQLQTLLSSENLSETGTKLVSLLSEFQSSDSEKMSGKVLSQLMGNWLGQNKESSQISFQLLQKLGVISKGTEESVIKGVIDHLLMQSSKINVQNIQGIETAKEQLLLAAGDKEKINKIIQQLLKSNGESLNFEQKTVVLRELLLKLNALGETIPDKNIQTIYKSILSALTEGLNQTESNKQIVSLFSNQQDANRLDQALRSFTQALTTNEDNSATVLTKSEQTYLKQIINDARNQLTFWENSSSVSDHLKQVIKAFGYQHEHDVVKLLKNGEIIEERPRFEELKPLLIKFLNEGQALKTKETAEHLLNKITGFQTLSQELGPTQQYILQVPLNLWNKSVDLTIQWNGQKKEKGQIDPNYCRVIFYLELQSLKETIVDVQIQNRIMNVTVINDTESIKAVAAPFIHGLKENLQALNYQLTSISFEKTFDKKDWKAKKAFDSIYESKQYSGVDLKI